jgi:hypothetical protein
LLRFIERSSKLDHRIPDDSGKARPAFFPGSFFRLPHVWKPEGFRYEQKFGHSDFVIHSGFAIQISSF